jgi:RNA polymerase sigma-70 factor (ECF subfamily)
VVPTRANGHPALAMYMADPHAEVYRGYSLLVITSEGDRITSITGFEASVLPRFGLPRILPATN